MEDTPHLPRFRTLTRTLTTLLAVTLAPLATAAPPAAAPPPTTPAPTWQSAATAAQLMPAHIEQLARDKLLIGPQTHRQIFTPYTAPVGDKVRFITSDAALAAYHALFEDSFRELELRRAYILRRHLETLFKQTRGKTPELSPAQEFIQQLLGPALVTLGAPPTNFDEKLRPEIKKQAALIRAATDVSLPEWLGPPSRDLESLDYRRCKPVSFYAGQPALKNYFRAMRWLQLVPLRADRNNELTAWALLAHVVNDQENPRLELGDFFSSLSLFVGPEADQGLSIPNEGLRWTARMVANSADYPSSQQDALIDLRAALLEAHADSPLRSINDELRQNLHNTSNNARLATIRFRIAPTFALPDAELISQSLDAQIRPNGLMIAALLGSTFAEERMPQVPANDWAKWKKSARALTLSQDGAPRSLYADYFDTLRALNAPPVENAPAFMRSSAWQAKTVQTQLASWAQARHTYALQAKLSIMYFGSIHYSRPPPGFVEPNPSFWREYNHLVERTTSLLKAGGVFTPSPFLMAFELRKAAAQIERRGLHREEASLTTLENDDFHTGTIRETITRLGNKSLLASSHYTSDEEMRIDYRDAIAFLKDIADKTERGEFSPVDLSPSGHPTLAARWESLETLSRQLETILAKQLDETELNHLERMVLIHFGNKLARTMGYFHFAERDVRDDAPRWAEVAHDVDADESLGIGTNRAQTLHVLYPWHGKELLCIGAVLPYFEEWAPTKRLTDDEWRQKLDSPAAPPPPTWIQPLLAR